ncbi:MAG: hypothetical protein WD648_13455 [Planctomycetaceae bacterium]
MTFTTHVAIALADSFNNRSNVHRSFAKPAATAGVVFNVMCGRHQLYQQYP